MRTRARSNFTAAAWYAAKMLKTVRERIQMERYYTTDSVADAVADAVHELFSEPLDARLTAEVDGDKIMLTVYPYDDVTDEVSSKGRIYTLTVSDGYAMTIGRKADDEEETFASWGERY